MEQEKNIVERLRDQDDPHDMELRCDAADEIERLRGELHEAFNRGLNPGMAEGLSQKEHQARQSQAGYQSSLGQQRDKIAKWDEKTASYQLLDVE